MINSGSGGTALLTGLPSAGKTTVASTLAERLRAQGQPVEVLDGDELRISLSAELGFSREHRNLNVTRAGYVATLLARNGVVVLLALIAPYAQARDAVRAAHAKAGLPFAEIHVAAPIAVCMQRDVKGLYARQAKGRLTGLTGVDDPYEEPKRPELRLETHEQTVTESVNQLSALLTSIGAIPPGR